MCGHGNFGVCTRIFASVSASAEFCRNRMRMSVIRIDKQVPVTVKQVADKSVGTPPLRGVGCLCLERFRHEFAILHYILQLLLQFEKKSEYCCIIMTSVGHARIRSWTQFCICGLKKLASASTCADADVSAHLWWGYCCFSLGSLTSQLVL